MAAVAAADLHQSSRSLGCCSGHAWQAEDWVADRCRLRVRYRCYRYHHREESWGLEVPGVALAHWEGLAEAADRFRQG